MEPEQLQALVGLALLMLAVVAAACMALEQGGQEAREEAVLEFPEAVRLQQALEIGVAVVAEPG